jgi:hypothetical protein
MAVSGLHITPSLDDIPATAATAAAAAAAAQACSAYIQHPVHLAAAAGCCRPLPVLPGCRQLFDVIQNAGDNRSFVVRAQFLEIYNEEVRDLLAPPGSSSNGSGSSSGMCMGGILQERQRGSGIAIRECPDGQIVVAGGCLAG